MRTLLLGALALFTCLTSLPEPADAQVSVHGYMRSNGTYVAPYVRTFPDGNPCNNYSSRC